jgi:hypothetical protein
VGIRHDVPTDRARVHLNAQAADNVSVRKLIDTIGANRFEAACEWAWATAKGCGEDNPPETHATEIPGDPARVPHELAERIWFGSETNLGERLHVALDLYARMPCYVTLMYIRHFAAQFDGGDRGMLWDSYRRWLEVGDDRLADPVAHSLTTDYFPSLELAPEAWRALCTLEQPRVRRLKRLLQISGPVPYHLKASLYDRLMADARWHPFILTSLLHSRSSPHGHIDLAAAREVLSSLRLSVAAPELELTRERMLER